MALASVVGDGRSATLSATNVTRVTRGTGVNFVTVSSTAALYWGADDALADNAALPATNRAIIPANVPTVLDLRSKAVWIAAAAATPEATVFGYARHPLGGSL